MTRISICYLESGFNIVSAVIDPVKLKQMMFITDEAISVMAHLSIGILSSANMLKTIFRNYPIIEAAEKMIPAWL